MSLLGLYPCNNISAPTYLSFTSASTTILSSIVAIVDNFLVVVAVLLDSNRDLRSPFGFFVANLGLADLTVGLVTAPMGTIYLISEGLKRVENLQGFRRWMHVCYFISCSASLLSLTALALDRYIAITYPLHYRSKLNPTRALFISCLVWITSILLSLFYFTVGYNRFRIFDVHNSRPLAMQVPSCRLCARVSHELYEFFLTPKNDSTAPFTAMASNLDLDMKFSEA